MAVILIKVFDGLRPIQDPVLLKADEATVAKNARLLSGRITSLKGTTTLKSTTKLAPQTIWRYGTSTNEGDYWLEFTDEVDVARSPVVNDPYARVYWTDGGAPKYAPNSMALSGSSYPGGYYTLGVPVPGTAPTINSYTVPAEAAYTETRTYVYTYVSAYGEEGPPSAASALVSVDSRQAVTVLLPSTAPSGAYNITLKRIYRSSATGAGAQFQFVAEVPVSATQYTDFIAQSALGETLPSSDWESPPVGLRGLKITPNGMAVGFKENTVYVTEPNLPHAWSSKYAIDDPIVGVGVFRQSVVLLTTGYPVMMSGVDPRAMTLEKLELPQACMSKGSIVDTGDGVIYASPDGLVSIGAGGISLATKELLSREDWQAYNPKSIRAVVHDNRYHMMYTTAAGARGMVIFDFSGQGATMSTCDINAGKAITAAYSDTRTDTLYLAQENSIVRFNSGNPLVYTWRSKVFRVPAPLNFTNGQVLADVYPVVFNLYADGVLKHTTNVTSQALFRLPGGFRAIDWQVEVVGTTDVTQVAIGTSAAEMRQT